MGNSQEDVAGEQMKEAKLSPFFTSLLEQHANWTDLPFAERVGEEWRGVALVVPAPAGSDIAGDLDIEEVGGEITISFDHAHIHMEWPPRSGTGPRDIWRDPLLMIGAILNESVVASSGWIGGRLRAGSLGRVDEAPALLVPSIEYIRVRSWLGTFDRDIGQP